MIRSLWATLTAILLTACGSSDHTGEQAPAASSPVAGQAQIPAYDPPRDCIVHVRLPAGTSQSYALYIPASTDSAGIPRSIIVFADPHGAGRLPVEKYRKLADRFHIALAGSDNSRNGLDVNLSVSYINNIIHDLQARLHYDIANICLAGFSGGSKVSLQAAANNPNITNIIYAGAVIPFQPGPKVRLLGFAGTSDMNYSDLLSFAAQLPEGTGTLVEFAGKHEWPDPAVYQKAFYWLAIHQSRGAQDPYTIGTSKAYMALIHRQVTTALAASNTLSAYDLYREAYHILAGTDSAAPALREMEKLSASPLYKKQAAQKEEMLKSETNQKQILLQAFQNQDLPWWASTISHLRSSSSPADQRLLGFISLACYSYTSQCIARADMAHAAHFAAIYEQADPDNTDQLYFHAIIAARQGDNGTAMRYMQKAVNKGFSDWGKADAEPALATVRGQGSFSRLQAQPSSGRSSR